MLHRYEVVPGTVFVSVASVFRNDAAVVPMVTRANDLHVYVTVCDILRMD